MEISLAGALVVIILILEIIGAIKRKDIIEQNEYIITLLENRLAKDEIEDLKQELEEREKK